MKTKTIFSLAAALGGLLLAGNAFAQAAVLPEWDKLTPQQREMLIAPLRERWNGAPEQRARMFEHARRWQQMTPEQRAQARKGMRRFVHMKPEQREHARALYARMRDMPPEERQQLAEQWKAMTPEQRDRWVQDNPPPKSLRPPR